jgi:hypothetical protein
MAHKPPKPVCRTFFACRRIIKDEFTRDLVLIAPLVDIQAVAFPLIADVSVYVRISAGQGSYQLELQLQTLEGDVVWREQMEPPLDLPDPLLVAVKLFLYRRIYMPKPAQYDLVLLANGDEISRDVIYVNLLNRTPQL